MVCDMFRGLVWALVGRLGWRVAWWAEGRRSGRVGDSRGSGGRLPVFGGQLDITEPSRRSGGYVGRVVWGPRVNPYPELEPVVLECGHVQAREGQDWCWTVGCDNYLTTE